MPPNLPFGSNLFSSLKQRLREWIRREIVDDDPWDEASSFFADDRSDLDRANTEAKNNIETNIKTDIKTSINTDIQIPSDGFEISLTEPLFTSTPEVAEKRQTL